MDSFRFSSGIISFSVSYSQNHLFAFFQAVHSLQRVLEDTALPLIKLICGQVGFTYTAKISTLPVLCLQVLAFSVTSMIDSSFNVQISAYKTVVLSSISFLIPGGKEELLPASISDQYLTVLDFQILFLILQVAEWQLLFRCS